MWIKEKKQSLISGELSSVHQIIRRGSSYTYADGIMNEPPLNPLRANQHINGKVREMAVRVPSAE